MGWKRKTKKNPSTTGSSTSRAATSASGPPWQPGRGVSHWQPAPAGDPEETSAPGWASYSLSVIFVTNYTCHCVKWWKAGGVGSRAQMEKTLFLLFFFLIDNIAIIPYKRPRFILFLPSPRHSWSSCFVPWGVTVTLLSLWLRQAGWWCLIADPLARSGDGMVWGNSPGLWDTAGQCPAALQCLEQALPGQDMTGSRSTHLLGQPALSGKKTRIKPGVGAAWYPGDGLLQPDPSQGSSGSCAQRGYATCREGDPPWPTLGMGLSWNRKRRHQEQSRNSQALCYFAKIQCHIRLPYPKVCFVIISTNMK